MHGTFPARQNTLAQIKHITVAMGTPSNPLHDEPPNVNQPSNPLPLLDTDNTTKERSM